MRRDRTMDTNPFRDIEASPRQHQIAVENLAKSMKWSINGVNAVYGLVLRNYMRNARIKSFLTALVTKRVKEVMRDTTPTTDIEGRTSHSREL
jgi:hypothetical protein